MKIVAKKWVFKKFDTNSRVNETNIIKHWNFYDAEDFYASGEENEIDGVLIEDEKCKFQDSSQDVLKFRHDECKTQTESDEDFIKFAVNIQNRGDWPVFYSFLAQINANNLAGPQTAPKI